MFPQQGCDCKAGQNGKSFRRYRQTGQGKAKPPAGLKGQESTGAGGKERQIIPRQARTYLVHCLCDLLKLLLVQIAGQAMDFFRTQGLHISAHEPRQSPLRAVATRKWRKLVVENAKW